MHRDDGASAPYENQAIICLLGILILGSLLAITKQSISPVLFVAGICVVSLLAVGLGIIYFLSSPERQT